MLLFSAPGPTAQRGHVQYETQDGQVSPAPHCHCSFTVTYCFPRQHKDDKIIVPFTNFISQYCEHYEMVRYLIKSHELQFYIFLRYLSLRTMCNYVNTIERSRTLETSG